MKLDALDTAAIDELVEIRSEQSRLSDHCAKAADLRSRFSDAVWRLVVADYESRVAALERRATPLELRLQNQYMKLRGLQEQLEHACAKARLATEELELRAAVGELTQAQLDERIASPKQVLDGLQQELAAAIERKETLVATLGSDADLESRYEESTQLPAISVVTDPDNDTTREVAPASRKGGARPGAPPDPAAEDGVASETVLVPRATAVVSFGDSEPTSYRLVAINYLGREEDNQIRITRPGVSRRHAVIEVTSNGLVLKDLGSQNGTFLNGQPVTEQTLSDGDQIVIGDAQVVIQMIR